MMQSDSHEEHKRHTFDSYCKKVVKNEAINIQKRLNKQRKREMSFSDLSEWELERLAQYDEYTFEVTTFQVLVFNIGIKNELLSESMSMLSKDKQQIILLSYFFDMTDQEIADALSLARSTIQYKRTKALEELQKMMKGNEDDGKAD